jgi:hypothetical protein
LNDESLSEAWTTLEPAEDRRRRIETRVQAWLDARDTPLAAEWLGLVRVAPLPAVGLAAVSAVAIVMTPPMVWIAWALM